MNFDIPIFIEELPASGGKPPSFIVRPAFDPAFVQRADKLSRALARLTTDLQNHLHQLGTEPRHESLARWTSRGPLKEATLELRLDLDSGDQKLRLFFLGYQALNRELWFSPALPDIHFEVLPGQQLESRASLVFTRHFRQIEREGFLELSEHALAGRARLAVLPIALQPGALAKAPSKPSRTLLFGEEEKIDGERELRRIGRPLHALYPDDLQRAVGLDREVDELARLLAASDRRPIVLVGPRKVGKTTLLHELAWRIASRKREKYANGREIWLLSPMRLISGMSHLGEWESRVTAILDHAARRDRTLYFDDLLGLFTAGHSNASDLSIAHVLKPALTRRAVRVLAEITPEAWRILRERDRAFADLFHVIPIAEPPEPQILRVLIDVSRRLELEHRCRFDVEVVPAVFELQRRHAGDAAFPGKAAAFLRHLANRNAGGTINRETVLAEFHRISGLRLTVLDDQKTLNREAILHELRTGVLGQDQVLHAFADILVTLKARLNDPGRPLGTFLLLGPTGVGKTESAKALARLLFGSEDRLLRLDMNEFVDGASTARLTGTPADPDGLLTSAIRRQPFSIVLLDEFEKAAPEVSDLLLAVLDEGRLTDALGRVADFSQSVILLTSNLGAREARSRLGFSSTSEPGSEDAIYLRAAEQFFRPEFFNRLDRVIPFRSLDRTQLERIARRLVNQVLERDGLRRRRCLLLTTPPAIDRLVQLGYHPQLGARALKRVVEREIAQPLATRLANVTDTAPLVAQLHADSSGFELQTRTVELASLSVHWPRRARELAQHLAAGCPEFLLDVIEDVVEAIRAQLEPEAPSGPIELGRIPRQYARYFLCRERLDHIQRLLATVEATPDNLRARPTINRRPSPKPVKVVSHSHDSTRSRLVRQRAAAALQADLADLADRENPDPASEASGLESLFREIALLHALSSGSPEHQVVLVLESSLGDPEKVDCIGKLALIHASLDQFAGFQHESVRINTRRRRILGTGNNLFVAQGIQLFRILQTGSHWMLVDQPDGSVRFTHTQVIPMNSLAEAHARVETLQPADFVPRLDALGLVQFRARAVMPSIALVPVIEEVHDLSSGERLAPNTASNDDARAFLLSALPLPPAIDDALARAVAALHPTAP